MKVASWNIEGRLTRFANDGDRGSPEQIVREIERLKSDVLFLPEAFDQAKPIEPLILTRLQSLGYSMVEATYNDSGDREYAAATDPHMLFLSRLPISSSEIIRLGGIRNMLSIELMDPETGKHIRILNVHLDDRSEENRIRQLEDLLPVVAASTLPTVMMGDFNAMHRESFSARVVRKSVVLGLIKYWPHRRSKSILMRLSDMAIGEVMSRIIEKTNLLDVDPKNRPTTTPKMRGQEWMPSIRMVQIDHILVSSEIKATNFTIARDGGSDHRAISATLMLTRQK